MNFLNSFSNLGKNFVARVTSLLRFIQLGIDIDGEAAEDNSGFSVSMNAAGDRVAIGAIGNDGTSGTDRGHVRIYQWNGTAWTQMGADIDGEAANDLSGYSVSMNMVGDRVAIGASSNDGTSGTDRGHARIYQWNGTAWTQMGADIDGEAAADNSGWSVSMNALGDRVAIGAVNNDGTSGIDRGHVRVYSWNGTAWTKLGADIDGEAAGDQSGFSVSMNMVGDRVAIGARYNDGNNTDSGHVRVYSWNGTAWTQLGSDIDGIFYENSGYSISMNAVGDRIAIAAPFNDTPNALAGIDTGLVRIYQWNGTAWTQMGADIYGESKYDNSGWSVSMNAVGDRVAIGAIQDLGGGYRPGHVRIYSWNGTAWTQLGLDIDGEVASYDNSGWSVSMNRTGDRVAIGARHNDGNGTDSGHVRVYSIEDLRPKSWVQLGADIDGEAADDESGISVSMNAAGDRMAIGAFNNDGTSGSTTDQRGHVRIYSWNGTAWVQMGADIDGEAAGDGCGWSVSMNMVGDRVAIGARWNAAARGHVRIYQWNGTTWTQLGTDIDGEAIINYSGYSVSMNAVGDRVAIGANENDGTTGLSSDNRGHVRIYQWNGTTWTQLGVDIDGEAAGDQSGFSVSMNAVGDRVAIGARYNDGTATNAGHVRMYQWNGTAWTQLGADIDGEWANDEFGYSVSMNMVGDRVAIGARLNDGTSGSNRGHVRIYSWNGTAWTQMGADIDGEAASDESGGSVSMNLVGDRVAIGALSNGATGHVRIYSWNGTAWTKLGADIDGEAAGDGSGGSVSMNAVGDRVVIGARLNDGTSGADRGHVRVYNLNLIS